MSDFTDYAGGHLAFAAWLEQTDRIMVRRYGVGLFDMADAPLRDFYDDGITPAQAVGLVMEADDIGSMMLDL